MNKKGSAIVESVMVFPVIVITLAVLICMMIFFYSRLNDIVDMHVMLRAESGRICGNMYYEHGNERGFTIYREPQQIYSSHVTELAVTDMPVKYNCEINARKYLINEVVLVRTATILGDTIADNDE